MMVIASCYDVLASVPSPFLVLPLSPRKVISLIAADYNGGGGRGLYRFVSFASLFT